MFCHSWGPVLCLGGLRIQKPGVGLWIMAWLRITSILVRPDRVLQSHLQAAWSPWELLWAEGPCAGLHVRTGWPSPATFPQLCDRRNATLHLQSFSFFHREMG